MKTGDARTVLEALIEAKTHISLTCPNSGHTRHVIGNLETAIDITMTLHAETKHEEWSAGEAIDELVRQQGDAEQWGVRVDTKDTDVNEVHCGEPAPSGYEPVKEAEADTASEDPRIVVREAMRKIFPDAKVAEIMDRIFPQPEEPVVPKELQEAFQRVAREQFGHDNFTMRFVRIA